MPKDLSFSRRLRLTFFGRGVTDSSLFEECVQNYVNCFALGATGLILLMPVPAKTKAIAAAVVASASYSAYNGFRRMMDTCAGPLR